MGRFYWKLNPNTSIIMGDAWDGTLEEWVVSEGHCVAAGMAQCTDGAFYAAAPVAGDAGWGIIYKEDHQQDIMQEDGVTTKKMTINEGWQMKQLLETGKTPPGGVWFCGEKYTVPQVDKAFEMGENTFGWAFAARPKKGVHIVSTGSQIVTVRRRAKTQAIAKKLCLLLPSI